MIATTLPTTLPAELSVWGKIGATMREEVLDLSNPEDATRVVMRLIFAAVLGGALGFERERKGKTAGLRTHILVALGAALFVLVPDLMGMPDGDIARVVQGLIAGVGFLGAGSIVKGNGGGEPGRDDAVLSSDPDAYRRGEVRGLTTAANLWMTAAIGMCVGLGRETTAVVATLLALFVLGVLPHGSKRGRR